jgi:hypothetical protein
MIRTMKQRRPKAGISLTLGCLLMLANPVWAQNSTVYILTSSDWNVPRTTRTVLAMPALRKTIQAYDGHSRARIQIHYPGGDEGTLWASELRSWLVSLGIASKHIDLLPGTRKPGQLELQVVLPTGYGSSRE